MNVKAERIVGQLLEEPASFVRACAACEKESGQPATGQRSHGLCKRHKLEQWEELYQRARQAGDSAQAAKVKALIERDEQRPDAEFPPDLSKPQPAHAA